jgi:hypothetical protein
LCKSIPITLQIAIARGNRSAPRKSINTKTIQPSYLFQRVWAHRLFLHHLFKNLNLPKNMFNIKQVKKLTEMIINIVGPSSLRRKNNVYEEIASVINVKHIRYNLTNNAINILSITYNL